MEKVKLRLELYPRKNDVEEVLNWLKEEKDYVK